MTADEGAATGFNPPGCGGRPGRRRREARRGRDTLNIRLDRMGTVGEGKTVAQQRRRRPLLVEEEQGEAKECGAATNV